MSNPKPEDLVQIDYQPNQDGWADPKVEFRKGTFCYSALARNLTYLGLPNPREWQPFDADWKLPADWKQIILNGMKERLDKYPLFPPVYGHLRALRRLRRQVPLLYRIRRSEKYAGAARAELIRSVYRRYFTAAGKLFGTLAGARELTEDVIKEWFYYFYQCTECRRCSVFCPYGIDTAEITMIGRELLKLMGCNINWVLEPAANCFRTGNHLGIQPHGFKDSVDFAVDELEEITGVRVEASINRKGAEILLVVPSADYFGTPHYYTFLGYLALLHEIGLDYTFSAFASEGGNFGLFTSHEMMKRLNAKIYAEAQTPGGEVDSGRRMRPHVARPAPVHGHHERPRGFSGSAGFARHRHALRERALHQDGPHLRVHRGPDPQRQAEARPIAQRPLERDLPRFLQSGARHGIAGRAALHPATTSVNQFHEMPENTIREQTFCCGSGSGLGTDENFEMRMRGGLPRANAVRYVHEKYGVNLLACICAIDKATLPTLLEYWVPGVDVAGVHELVGNALVMKGEKESDHRLARRGNPANGGSSCVIAPSSIPDWWSSWHS